MTKDDTLAPEGQVWVCVHCGRFSRDKDGNTSEKSPGWDIGCRVHAILHRKESLVTREGRVIRIIGQSD